MHAKITTRRVQLAIAASSRGQHSGDARLGLHEFPIPDYIEEKHSNRPPPPTPTPSQIPAKRPRNDEYSHELPIEGPAKRSRGYEETEEFPFEEPVQRTRGYKEIDEIPAREPAPEYDGIQSIYGVPLPQSPPMLDLSDTPSNATKRRRDRRRKAMERRSAREAELLDTNGPPVERPAMGHDGAQSINEEAIPPTPPLCDRSDTLEPEIQGTEYFKRVGEKVYEKHKARLAEIERRGKSASGAERLQSVFENFSDVIFDKVFKKFEKKLDDVVFETILRANKDGYRIDSPEAARPFVR
ncbi:uncharacterized protein BKA78DRAFT_373442 [Phyllosticta capitalensis]|uniref:uncharacterized protein n=1 Tax=Phyllosticta capitalensis TaxID=121624 RepID=UPI0031325CC0